MRTPSKLLNDVLNECATVAKANGHPSPSATLIDLANGYGFVWSGSTFVPMEPIGPDAPGKKGGAR